MYKIKKIEVLSLAYNIGLVYLFFGLILGIILSIIRTYPSLSILSNETLTQLTLAQIILLYPVSYGVGGFIISLIIGILYNKISKLTGGISINLMKDSK
ncbi:MAG: hypothetical protein AABW83_02870 [Nanoarchaeota archaeon]